jgi:hypothetical protein
VWNYQMPPFSDLGGWGRIRELARSASGYAQFMAEFEQQPEEAERAGWAAAGLGYRIIGDWSLEDNPRTGKTVIRVLVGIAVVGIAYSALDKVYGVLGKPEKKAEAQAQYEAIKQRANSYREAVKTSLARVQNDFDYY